MTLTQTIVAPWGIWQCADYRLTRAGKLFENWSHKSLMIRCVDGGALVSYTGLGRFDPKPNSPDIANWIAAQLVGTTTVNQTLHRLKEKASQEARFRQTHHIFSVGAISHGQMWAALVANVEPRIDWRECPPRNSFELDARQVDGEPLILVCGETRAISQSDWNLLHTVAKRRPRRSKDFLALLAGVNKRSASHRRYGKVISEQCSVCFMPPGVDGSFGRTFPEDRDIPWEMAATPRVMFGVDSTDLSREVIRQLQEEVSKNKAAGLI